MTNKTKLTISIDKDLIKIFDSCCDYMSINKSKLVSGMIKQWCDGILPIDDKYLPENLKGNDIGKKWSSIK